MKSKLIDWASFADHLHRGNRYVRSRQHAYFTSAAVGHPSDVQPTLVLILRVLFASVFA
jgi:hypothetical protein